MARKLAMIGRILIGTLALVVYTHVVALAQHGGKAEPRRIQFKRGAVSASITDSVRGDEEAEYVVGAKAGQTIHLAVDSTPRNSAVVSSLVKEGGSPVPLSNEGRGRWSARLDEDSDYVISLAKAHPDRTTARYRLTVEIR